MAGRADPQLPGHSYPISNCELNGPPLRRFPVLTVQSSLLFRRLVSRGPHTSRSLTPPKRPEYAHHSEYHVNDLASHHIGHCFQSIFRGVSVSVGPCFLALCIRDIELRGKTWLHSKRTLDLFIAFGDIHLRYQSLFRRQRGVFGWYLQGLLLDIWCVANLQFCNEAFIVTSETSSTRTSAAISVAAMYNSSVTNQS